MVCDLRHLHQRRQVVVVLGFDLAEELAEEERVLREIAPHGGVQLQASDGENVKKYRWFVREVTGSCACTAATTARATATTTATERATIAATT